MVPPKRRSKLFLALPKTRKTCAGALQMPQFLGFDHVDTRVRSLTAVEAFYDRLMPEVGLPEKDCHIVDAAGNWRRAKPGEHYNKIEYHEKPTDGRPAH